MQQMRLLIWGTGGVALHALDVARTQLGSVFHRIDFLCDDLPLPPAILGVPVLGSRRLLDACDPRMTQVYPAGSTPAVRRVMSDYLRSQGFSLPTLISPLAQVAASAEVGAGSLVQAFAWIGHRAQLGPGLLMGVGAHLAHDTELGAYCSLYTGARVLGHTHLGEGILVGANAVVMSYRRLGAWSKVSMGAMVFDDLPAYVTVAGNPAQITRRYAGPQPAQLRGLRD